MASRRTLFNGRVCFSLQQGRFGGAATPNWMGYFRAPGRWMNIGPVFIRLGSRSSWEGEDQDYQMITPVKPD